MFVPDTQLLCLEKYIKKIIYVRWHRISTLLPFLASSFCEAHNATLEFSKLATLHWFGMVVRIHVISRTVPYAYKTLFDLISDKEITNVEVS